MSRKLIVCADGTWNAVEKDEEGALVSTNVSKLAGALARCDAENRPQLLCYLEGVGTHPEEVVGGGVFGAGLGANVLRAYQFLVDQYQPGDTLHFFGFSRGAYTVRSLAGLLANSGLLRRDTTVTVADAFALYRDRSPDTTRDSVRARVFRQMHAHDVEIEFIGVWDTVGTLGVPLLSYQVWQALGYAWQFHNVTLGPHIRHACHALAIHEQRGPFLPTLWVKPVNRTEQTLEQVWFCGAHADVGGGYRETGLSDLSMEWMIERASAADRGGLAFRPSWKEDCDWQGSVQGTRHSEFKGLFALLARLKQKKDGYLRTFRAEVTTPGVETGEDIHPSVRTRAAEKIAGDFWPPTFPL